MLRLAGNVDSSQSYDGSSSRMMKNEILVGNLSYFCEEKDLFDLFDSYADVVHCRIMRDSNNSDKKVRSLLFGFVTLSSVHEAKEMAKLMNGMLFMGRLLRVDVCYSNYDRRSGSQQHTTLSDLGTQLHVTFDFQFTNNYQLVQPTETLLRKAFTSFGTLLDVSVKDYSMLQVRTTPSSILSHSLTSYHTGNTARPLRTMTMP